MIFEHAGRLGGQWASGEAHSGVWPGMRTNTSRVLSRFSDLDHAPETPVYPTAMQMEAYLGQYADAFGLTDGLQLNSPVTLSRASGGGWRLKGRSASGDWSEAFPQVVVSSGRYNKPKSPDTPGLAGFTGHVGHAVDYGRDRRPIAAG